MTAPTLPGDILGLLRRGSPVVTADGPGVVVCIGGDMDARWCVVSGAFSHGDRPTESIPLDLSDVTGRAHALWWLAAWWETHRGNGTPSEVPLRGCVWSRCGLTSWRLMWSGCAVTFDPDGCSNAATYVAVPLLANQPDDAEALRLTVLHVAGVTP